MAEPRARVMHHKGHPNFSKELKLLMYAYGDDLEPLDETVKVLDEVVTDFIIETCHEASRSAQYARRQKIKVDDFRFALRKDPVKLGRVQELLQMDKVLKDWRKAFNENDDRLPTDLAGVDADGELDGETDGGRTRVGEKGRAGARAGKRAGAAAADGLDADDAAAAGPSKKKRRRARKDVNVAS